MKITDYMFKNKKQLNVANRCGCAYCLEIFSPMLIKDWIDNDETAICPFCDVDSIIPQTLEISLTTNFLKEIQTTLFKRAFF